MFKKISQNFVKSPLKFCLISQILVHNLWHVCMVFQTGWIGYSISNRGCNNSQMMCNVGEKADPHDIQTEKPRSSCASVQTD